MNSKTKVCPPNFSRHDVHDFYFTAVTAFNKNSKNFMLYGSDTTYLIIIKMYFLLIKACVITVD